MKKTYLFTALAGTVLLAGACSTPPDPAAQGPADETVAKSAPQAVAPKPVAPRVVTIPTGTAIKIRTTNALSTENAQAGDSFQATLAEPLVLNGKQLAPQGADVDAVVVNADKGGRVKGVASISIRPTKLYLAEGPVTVRTGAYTKEARATKKNDAVKVGIASGIGAAIGAIAGGGKGAAIGAAGGAGAGTGVVLATRGEPAVIGAESLITFRLTAPVQVN